MEDFIRCQNLESVKSEFCLRLSNNPGEIFLGMGSPGPDTLVQCVELFSKATEHRMSKECTSGLQFQYGYTSGDYEFRTTVAGFLARRYKSPVNQMEILLTAGASNGLFILSTLFFSTGSHVFVENPTYHIGQKVFSEDLQMNVHGVSLTRNGIDINDLEHAVKKYCPTVKLTPRRPYRGLVYLIPTFHNPTGCCYTEDCCKEVVRVARENDLLVVCDDIYNLLYYTNQSPPKRLFTFDNYEETGTIGHVVSNGSFSKILAPGYRVGWMEAPLSLIKTLYESRHLDSGGALNHLMSGIISSTIQLGLMDQMVDHLMQKYKSRVSAAYRCLTKNLPAGCRVFPSHGGYFLWLEFPENIESEKFMIWLREKYNVSFAPGNIFSVSGEFRNCGRIAISYFEEDKIVSAVEKLCVGLKEYIHDR